MTIGEIIKQKRIDNNLSQEDLSTLLNVSRVSISKWENNQQLPNTSSIIALSKLFNCSIDELADFKAENNSITERRNRKRKEFILDVALLCLSFISFSLFCLMMLFDSISETPTELKLNAYFIFEFLSISVFIICFTIFMKKILEKY